MLELKTDKALSINICAICTIRENRIKIDIKFVMLKVAKQIKESLIIFIEILPSSEGQTLCNNYKFNIKPLLSETPLRTKICRTIVNKIFATFALKTISFVILKLEISLQ